MKIEDLDNIDDIYKLKVLCEFALYDNMFSLILYREDNGEFIKKFYDISNIEQFNALVDINFHVSLWPVTEFVRFSSYRKIIFTSWLIATRKEYIDDLKKNA